MLIRPATVRHGLKVCSAAVLRGINSASLVRMGRRCLGTKRRYGGRERGGRHRLHALWYARVVKVLVLHDWRRTGIASAAMLKVLIRCGSVELLATIRVAREAGIGWLLRCLRTGHWECSRRLSWG